MSDWWASRSVVSVMETFWLFTAFIIPVPHDMRMTSRSSDIRLAGRVGDGDGSRTPALSGCKTTLYTGFFSKSRH